MGIDGFSHDEYSDKKALMGLQGIHIDLPFGESGRRSSSKFSFVTEDSVALDGAAIPEKDIQGMRVQCRRGFDVTATK